MLKTFTANALNSNANAKCGEIFCHSYERFTIYCNFCEMKLFEFTDFILHLKNIHFEKNLLKISEVDIQNDNFNISLKNELISESEDVQLGSSSDLDDSQSEWCKAAFARENTTDSEDNAILENKRKRRTRSKQKSNQTAIAANLTNSEDNDTNDNEEFNTSRQQLKENNVSTGELFNCAQCGKSYINKGSLKSHVTKEHAILEVTECSECSKEFSNKRLLANHQVQEHGGFKCPQCDKRFKHNYLLVNHMPYHSGERSFKCDFRDCTKSFYNKRRLTTHIRTCHTGGKNYICETCGYRCHAQITLKVHVRTHTGEKPHPCEICEKRFVSHSSLAEHRASHRAERPYVCDVCGATFARQKALYHHKPLHLGIKKFICKVCGSAYAQAAGLAGHMRKHKDGLL